MSNPLKIRKIKKGEYTAWVRGENRHDFLVCENHEFARIAAVMIGSKISNPTWHDEIIFIEPSLNAVVVLVYKSKEIYLHQEYRPKVMKRGTKIKKFELDKLKLTSLGVWSREVPRGVSELKDKNSIDTAKRELEEETGIESKSIKISKSPIGMINPNTAYAVSTIPVYIAECKNKKINKDLISKEDRKKIRDREFYTIKTVEKKIKDKEIFCGVTLAALNLALQKLDKRPDRDASAGKPKKV